MSFDRHLELAWARHCRRPSSRDDDAFACELTGRIGEDHEIPACRVCGHRYQAELQYHCEECGGTVCPDHAVFLGPLDGFVCAGRCHESALERERAEAATKIEECLSV